MGCRWGLAWQTLPRNGEICWAPVRPPTLSRKGWAFLSTMTSAHPTVYQFPRREQFPGSPAGRGCPAVQGGHRESQQQDISRVLQPAVPGAEEDRTFVQ